VCRLRWIVMFLHPRRRFTSNLKFRVTNPKFSNEQLTVSSEALLVKKKDYLINYYIFIYQVMKPILLLMVMGKKYVKCHTNNINHFIPLTTIITRRKVFMLLWMTKNARKTDLSSVTFQQTWRALLRACKLYTERTGKLRQAIIPRGDNVWCMPVT
jgi:hypothetical protein